MDHLTIERIGGLGGFGLPGSRLSSRGKLPLSELSDADKSAVERLFKGGGGAPDSNNPHGFRYRITRETDSGPQTIEAPESEVPAALSSVVKDEFN